MYKNVNISVFFFLNVFLLTYTNGLNQLQLFMQDNLQELVKLYLFLRQKTDAVFANKSG